MGDALWEEEWLERWKGWLSTSGAFPSRAQHDVVSSTWYEEALIERPPSLNCLMGALIERHPVARSPHPAQVTLGALIERHLVA